jgi:hypothetical protein
VLGCERLCHNPRISEYYLTVRCLIVGRARGVGHFARGRLSLHYSAD